MLDFLKIFILFMHDTSRMKIIYWFYKESYLLIISRDFEYLCVRLCYLMQRVLWGSTLRKEVFTTLSHILLHSISSVGQWTCVEIDNADLLLPSQCRDAHSTLTEHERNASCLQASNQHPCFIKRLANGAKYYGRLFANSAWVLPNNKFRNTYLPLILTTIFREDATFNLFPIYAIAYVPDVINYTFLHAELALFHFISAYRNWFRHHFIEFESEQP